MSDTVDDLTRRIHSTDSHAAQVALLGLDEGLPIMPTQRLMLRALANLNHSRRRFLASMLGAMS
jgi:hypothetical protein